MKTIAIIDDDVYIGNMLEDVLCRAGYEVLRAYSGTEAVMLLKQKYANLVLLDLMLPGMNGKKVLPLLRGIPVIVLSAKVETSDKVSLLRSGADDYVTKPFDIDELLARIEVQLREPTEVNQERQYVCGDLILDDISHEVSVAGVPVLLTRTEYAILKLLMSNPRQVLAKSVLLDRISEDTPDCTESSLKTHISHLRSKLRAISEKEYVEAVWGIGFRLNF